MTPRQMEHLLPLVRVFHEAELRRLVVAPKPLPIKKLTAPRLAAHIQAVLRKPEMRSTSARLGQRMRNEDGVSEAVHLIEQVALRRAKNFS